MEFSFNIFSLDISSSQHRHSQSSRRGSIDDMVDKLRYSTRSMGCQNFVVTYEMTLTLAALLCAVLLKVQGQIAGLRVENKFFESSG